MPFFARAILCLIALCAASVAQAHEFWISPTAYVVQNGGQVQANLRVGEDFKGSAYAYNPKRFAKFELIQNGQRVNVKGRLGDTPALSAQAPGEGLLTVIHETSDSKLTYKEWKKFVKFTNHKDFAEIQQAHIDRGLPKENFVELYRRYGKSLIAVGSGAGADSVRGLQTEIVALANPYTDNLRVLPVRVLFGGKPRQNVQVELFEKSPSGSVKVTLHRTNGKGVAQIPIKPGHEYLVDSVTITPLKSQNPATQAVWYTHWASLTFAVP